MHNEYVTQSVLRVAIGVWFCAKILGPESESRFLRPELALESEVLNCPPRVGVGVEVGVTKKLRTLQSTSPATDAADCMIVRWSQINPGVRSNQSPCCLLRWVSQLLCAKLELQILKVGRFSVGWFMFMTPLHCVINWQVFYIDFCCFLKSLMT